LIVWNGTRWSTPSFLFNILTFHNIHDMVINDEKDHVSIIDYSSILNMKFVWA